MTALRGLAVAIIDFETTGPDPRTCWPVQVAVAHMLLGDTEPTVVLDQRIKPPVPIPEEASAVHGITDDDVAGCPTLDEAAPAIREAIAGRFLAAYNWPYEYAILDRHIEPGLSRDALDPLVWAKLTDKFASKADGGKKLDAVCRRRGIEIDAHDAGGDVRGTGLVMPVLLRELGRGKPGRFGTDGPWLSPDKLHSLEAFLRWQAKVAAAQDQSFVDYCAKNDRERPSTPWLDWSRSEAA